jgi:hypothetical protein
MADDIYVLACGINDNMCPINDLDNLYSISLKPTEFIEMINSFRADSLNNGHSNEDLAANIKMIASAIEVLVGDNKKMHEKMDMNSSTISTIQADINRLKSSNKENLMPSPSGKQAKKRRFGFDEFPPLTSSAIQHKEPPRFADIAKGLNDENGKFTSNMRAKSIVKGAKKSAIVKSCNHDRKFDVWLGHISIKEDETNVRALLRDIQVEHDIIITGIQKLQLSHAKFQSFKFSVPYNDRFNILKPEIWPEDLSVSRYTTPNPNKQQLVQSDRNKLATNKEIQNDSFDEKIDDDDK